MVAGFHERILARARALTWPARLADLETQADRDHDQARQDVSDVGPCTGR